MKYNQPYGISDPNGAYINGNPSTGLAGSIPPAESIEYPQREIVNLISDANLSSPSNSDLHQLAKAVQSTLLYSDDDTGSANQYSVTMTPAPTGYFKYMTVVAKMGNTNTGPSTLNVNALGAKPIVKIDGTALKANDILANAIMGFIYDGANFQIVWSSFIGTSQRVLIAPLTYYVNKATGDDTLYDGTSATVVGGTTKGPFKTIMKAVNTAYQFQPSASYQITIQIADNTYFESVVGPSIPGPSLIITGNAALPQNVLINSTGLGNAITVNGPNTWNVQNLSVQNTTVNQAGFCANGAGASMVTSNTLSNAVTTWCFLGNGLGQISLGSHKFNGSCGFAFASYRNGTIALTPSANYNILTPITVNSFAFVTSGGQIEVPASSVPTFTSPGSVTGNKYSATLNGVINTQGAGTSYFPGTVAGSQASGGQYG